MKFGKILFSILIATALLASCSGAQTATRGEPLRIPYTNWPGDYVSILARDLGLFAKYGVNVALVYYPTASAAYLDLVTEKLDGANISPIDLLPLIHSNDYRIVMVVDSSDGADQVVARSDLSVSNLSGARIGVNIGTSGEFLIREMLRNAGIAMDEIELIDIDPEAVPVAIPELIDAGHTAEPYTSSALRLGQKVIYSSSDIPGLLSDVFAFRLDVIEDRPEDIRNFTRAWLEAAEWWLANPVQGNQIIASLADIDLDSISTEGLKIYTLEDNRNTFAQYPGTNSSSIYFVLRSNLSFVIDSGIITSPPDIDLLVDTSFLP